MRNIAFYWGNIPNPLLGGIDRVTCVWAEAFAKSNYNVYCIYTGGNERPLPSCFISKFKWENPTHEYSSLRKFLYEHQIKIFINQRSYDRNIIRHIYQATKENNCKVFSVLHNIPGFEFYSRKGLQGLKKKIWIFFNTSSICNHYQELVTFSDKVVVLSPSYIDLFMKKYKIQNTQKIIGIPNPLTILNYESDLLQKENLVLVVSRLSEQQKRISLVLKIWKDLPEKIKQKWKLVIVGDGPDRNRYCHYVKSHNLSNIEFVGQQNPIPFYKKAKIFMMTSAYEGWGLTLLEAMEFEVVPIVFDSYLALHDIIKFGYNGIIVENNNIFDYKKQLTLLMTNDKLLDSMKASALNFVQNYIPEKLLPKWEKYFN